MSARQNFSAESRCGPSGTTGGFTLLEVLVAVALVAVVSTLAFLGLNALVQARAQTDIFARQWQQENRAWQWMRQDISQALPRPTRDENGAGQPAFIGRPGDFQLIRLRPFSWDEGTHPPVSPLQKVRWYWHDKRLWRASKSPPELRAPQWQLQSVMTMANAPVFEYRDSRGRWHRQWPPAQAEAPVAPAQNPLASRSALPRAIRWQWTDKGQPRTVVFSPLAQKLVEFP